MPRTFDVTTPSEASLDRPLVVILAWLGAQSRHASVYARMLSEHGVQTVTVIGNPDDIILGRMWKVKALAHDVLAFLKVSRQIPRFAGGSTLSVRAFPARQAGGHAS